MATNEKVQGLIAQSGRIPVIDNPDVMKQYGSKKMQGKNIQAIPKTVSAPIAEVSKYENQWNRQTTDEGGEVEITGWNDGNGASRVRCLLTVYLSGTIMDLHR